MANYSRNLSTCNFLLLEPEYRTFNSILNGLLTTVCVVLGCIGNVNSLHVIHKLNFHRNRGIGFGVSLLVLALWDTALLACALLYYGLASAALALDWSFYFTSISIFCHPIISTANTASVWLIVVITIQRYMATKNPFESKHAPLLPAAMTLSRGGRRKSSVAIYYRHRRKFKTVIFVSFMAALVNFPTFFELLEGVCWHEVRNMTVPQVQTTKFRVNGVYTLYYRVIARIIFNSFCPFLLIFVLTIITLVRLRLHKNERLQLGMDRENMNTTEQCHLVISIALIVKFLVLRWLPSGLDLWEAVTRYSATYTRAFMYTVDISNFLVVLNSATNSLVYIRGKNVVQVQLNKRRSWRPRLQSERNNLIVKSWPKIMEITEQNFGMRIVYAMVRTGPYLTDNFVISDRHSFDLLRSETFRKTSSLVTDFFNQLVNLLEKYTMSDKEVKGHIQRVGHIHHNLGVVFTTAVWREFKMVTLSIVGQCEYLSEGEKELTLEAWNNLISFLIGQMKLASISATNEESAI